MACQAIRKMQAKGRKSATDSLKNARERSKKRKFFEEIFCERRGGIKEPVSNGLNLKLVEVSGVEPLTYAMPLRRSTN